MRKASRQGVHQLLDLLLENLSNGGRPPLLAALHLNGVPPVIGGKLSVRRLEHEHEVVEEGVLVLGDETDSGISHVGYRKTISITQEIGKYWEMLHGRGQLSNAYTNECIFKL